MEIYATVAANGAQNVLVVRIPLPSNLNFQEWRQLVHTRDDVRVVEFVI